MLWDLCLSHKVQLVNPLSVTNLHRVVSPTVTHKDISYVSKIQNMSVEMQTINTRKDSSRQTVFTNIWLNIELLLQGLDFAYLVIR